jgi:hypothetical protein
VSSGERVGGTYSVEFIKMSDLIHGKLTVAADTIFYEKGITAKFTAQNVEMHKKTKTKPEIFKLNASNQMINLTRTHHRPITVVARSEA